MPAVQRNLLHGLLRHHLADRRRRGVDRAARTGDRDVLGEASRRSISRVSRDGLGHGPRDRARASGL